MPESKKILLLGGGGHCKSVLDSLIKLSCYEAIGIIEKNNGAKSGNLLGIPIVGEDCDLARLYSEEGYTDAFITVGSIGDTSLRKKLYEMIKQIGFRVPNIIDESSKVSPFARLGEGIFIGKNAVVNAEAYIGNCAILNTSSVVEHECRVGDFVHLSPGSILGGLAVIGNGTHIGIGSVIKQGIQIGENSLIGMGSVVLRNFGSNIIAYGNPCKEVEHE